MTKHIGLRSGINLLLFRTESIESLKQQALLFDKIGILDLNKCLEYDLNLDDGQLGDIQWLMEQSLIYNLAIQPFEAGTNKEIVAYLAEAGLESYAHTLNYSALMKASGIKSKSMLDEKWYGWRNAQESVSLRLLAIQTETLDNVNAVPLLPESQFVLNIPTSKMTDVAQVVINNLPLPDETTPWEDIIEYKKDEDVKQSLLTLRRWMRKIARENLPTHEIEEEIEWLTNEFHRHMNSHKMKSNTEPIEAIVKVSLEFIENLVKFNFSKLADPLFAIRKRRLSLMEAEMNAPGREIAYIIKTNEKFSGRS